MERNHQHLPCLMNQIYHQSLLVEGQDVIQPKHNYHIMAALLNGLFELMIVD